MPIMTRPVLQKLESRNKILLSFAILIVIATPSLFGLAVETQQLAAPQSGDAAKEAFSYEVASIKPSKSESGVHWVSLNYTPDGFIAKGVTLRRLIREAYGVEDSQITQTPPWLNSKTYDIEAKMDKGTMGTMRNLGPDELTSERHRMLKLLLGDRFGLSVHIPTKPGPIYALVVATNGPKLHESKPGETYANGIKGFDGVPLGPNRFAMTPTGELTVQALPMETVAHLLAMRLGVPVLDKTGLMGIYDFTLRWTPNEGETAGFNSPQDSQLDTPSPQLRGPTIFSALEEQLGLKLQSQKGSIQVLVIDRIEEKPTEN